MRIEMRLADNRRRRRSRQQDCPELKKPRVKGRVLRQGYARRFPNGPTIPIRLIHPMRRVGERGSGQWERIGWDDALDEMADRMAGDSRPCMVHRRWLAR
jgi:anaerobic selenocysteine-containing dehydrogenase